MDWIRNLWYGNPVYNVDIRVRTSNRPELSGVIDEVTQRGLEKAIATAQKIQGQHYLTDKGMIRPGYIEGLEIRTATMDIFENLVPLLGGNFVGYDNIAREPINVPATAHAHYLNGEVLRFQILRHKLFQLV